MPLDPASAPVADRVRDLNERYRHHGATAVLERALSDAQVGNIALVSSFGAESVVLLHMISVMDRTTPVLFIDTQMLFEETLQYQLDVSEKLGLTDVRSIRPDPEKIRELDRFGALHLSDPDACCDLRKTQTLASALAPFDAWITGRKRFQGGQRAALEFFENEGDIRIKVNPLAHWAKDDVRDYMINNRLPRHPLVSQGYPSIGCKPCTSKVAEGEDERAGRWRGKDKVECGIHFINGKPVRRVAEGTEGEATPQEETTMSVIVTDGGFAADDWNGELAAPEDTGAAAVLLPSDADPEVLRDRLDQLKLVAVDFPSFADGRGFTIARRLRLMGYTGRLRAKGHVIADQYAMARRVGFDEVEIDLDLATRQPEDQWLRRAEWKAHDYQSRLRA